MKCIKPNVKCRFRDANGMCKWSCKEDNPPSNCEIANDCWGCPFVCYYEAKEAGCEDKDMFGGELNEL